MGSARRSEARLINKLLCALPTALGCQRDSSRQRAYYCGLTIFCEAGRLIHSWKAHMSPVVITGISECMMPRPAVIHCSTETA